MVMTWLPSLAAKCRRDRPGREVRHVVTLFSLSGGWGRKERKRVGTEALANRGAFPYAFTNAKGNGVGVLFSVRYGCPPTPEYFLSVQTRGVMSWKVR